MQIISDLYTPEELRAGAAFLSALAQLREDNPVPTLDWTPAPPANTPAPEAKPETTKRTRAKKEETPPAATEAKKEETPPAAEAKKDDAPNPLDVVNEAAAKDAEADAKAAAGGDKITHDHIRKLIGELSQLGKRNDAVLIVRNRNNASGSPCNGVSEIQEQHLAEIHAALTKLKG